METQDKKKRKAEDEPATRRIRIPSLPTLELVCERYGTTKRDSHTLIAEGRKTIHILSYGCIDSITCFIQDKPASSRRGEKSGDDAAQHTSIVIPNGWKVAAYIHEDLWIGEISYDHHPTRAPMYQFSKLNEQGDIVERSGWQKSPSGAFNSTNMSRKSDKPLRHNGKLFLGVHYEIPQEKIRAYFASRRDQVSKAFIPLLDAWLENRPFPERTITFQEKQKKAEAPPPPPPPPPILPVPPPLPAHHGTTIQATLAASDVFRRILAVNPSIQVGAIQDLFKHLPFLTWTRGAMDPTVHGPDLVEFVRDAEIALMQLRTFGESVGLGGVYDGIGDMLRLLRFFDDSARSTTQRKVLAYIHSKLMGYLYVHGVFDPRAEDAFQALTGIPPSTELADMLLNED